MTIGFYAQGNVGKIMAYDDTRQKKTNTAKNSRVAGKTDRFAAVFCASFNVCKICCGFGYEKNVDKRKVYLFFPEFFGTALYI